MLRHLSYRSRLLLRVIPILVLGSLTLNVVAYWYIDNLIRHERTASMVATTGKTAESINAWLKTILLESEVMATTEAAKAINTDFRLIDAQNINRYLLLHQKYPFIFQDVYAANRIGEHHTVENNGNGYSLFVGNIWNRPYFQSILAGGPAQITPPLVSQTTGIATIFAVAPIKDDQDRPQGLVGAGISLANVQKIAESLKASESGYGLILAKDGTIIYHPNRSFVMQKKISEVGDQSLHELGRLMMAGGSGMQRYTSLGVRKVAFYEPIPIAGWSVATLLPEAELYAPAVQMVKFLAIISFVLLLLVSSAIFMVARRLTKPLLELAHNAQEIAGGNLAVKPLEVKTQDEVGQLTASFNHMSAQLVKRDAEIQTSRLAGMAEVATSVLHNVGNVLNSVNVSATLVAEQVRHSKVANVAKVSALLREHEADLGSFVTSDPRGRQVPGYLQTLAGQLEVEQRDVLKELESLGKNIEYIKDIVAMQQNYSKISGVIEALPLVEIVEDALRMDAGAFVRHDVTIVREYQTRPTITVEKHKVLQILVNLLRNAKDACSDSGRPDKKITVQISENGERIKIAIRDNGVGISAENLTQVFSRGFTTRAKGHGFGLHSGALAARELGGSLSVSSEGPNQGSTFILELPRQLERKSA